MDVVQSVHLQSACCGAARHVLFIAYHTCFRKMGTAVDIAHGTCPIHHSATHVLSGASAFSGHDASMRPLRLQSRGIGREHASFPVQPRLVKRTPVAPLRVPLPKLPSSQVRALPPHSAAGHPKVVEARSPIASLPLLQQSLTVHQQGDLKGPIRLNSALASLAFGSFSHSLECRFSCLSCPLNLLGQPVSSP